MFAPAAYINPDVARVEYRQNSGSAYVAQYYPARVDDKAFSTASMQDLLMNQDFAYTLKRQLEVEKRERVKERIHKMCASFVSHGGSEIGLVASRVFVHVGSELVDLPFKDVLAQYSPSNEEIKFDMLFEKGIEVSVAKYLDNLAEDLVMFSLRVDGEPYVINTKKLQDLKDVLLETLSC